MLVAGRKEGVASGFDGRMAGLYRLLRRGQVGADKDVGVRDAARNFTVAGVNLPESGTVHGSVPVKVAENHAVDHLAAKAVPIGPHSTFRIAMSGWTNFVKLFAL